MANHESVQETAPVIIIGSGLAGYNVAREFRKLDPVTELVIISADDAEFYSKPMLSNALAKNKLAHELPTANAEKMAADLNATILSQTRVEKIDPENKQIYLSGNKVLSYRQLVLAMGASPVEVALQGNALDKILHVNDLQGYAHFRNAISEKKKVSIIGAGLIGCEFANDLILSGYEVSIIHRDALPLNRLLPESASVYLKNALTEQGITWHLGRQVKQINHDGQMFQIELDDGSRLESDVVLSAIGLRANIKLAEAAGIKVNKAIVVNRYLETSHQDIYALGDCAEVDGLFLPYVFPLMNSARALAKNLLGEKIAVSFPAMPVMVKTPSCAVVVSAPAEAVSGSWVINEDEHGVHASYVDQNGVLHGFALVGKAVEDKQRLTKELPAVLS